MLRLLGALFVFGDDPAVEPQIGALLGHVVVERHRAFAVLGVFRDVHRIHGVAAPGEVEPDGARHHVVLARIRLEAEQVFLHVEQDLLHFGDRLFVRTVHVVGHLRGVVLIRKLSRFVAGFQVEQLLFKEDGEPHEVGIAHVVFGRDFALDRLVEHERPAEFELFFGDIFGVVNEPRRAPHVSRGILAPLGFAAAHRHRVGVEFLLDEGGDVVHIVVELVALVEELLGIGFEHILGGELHDHVFGRAQKVVSIAQLELVIHVLVGAEGGVFHRDGGAVRLFVPHFEVLDEGGRGAVLVDFVVVLIGAFAALVDVFFPIVDAKEDAVIPPARRKGGEAGDKERRCGKQGKDALFHALTPLFSCFFLPVRLAASTTMRMMTKMTVVSAQKEESVSAVWTLPFIVAL